MNLLSIQDVDSGRHPPRSHSSQRYERNGQIVAGTDNLHGSELEWVSREKGIKDFSVDRKSKAWPKRIAQHVHLFAVPFWNTAMQKAGEQK